MLEVKTIMHAAHEGLVTIGSDAKLIDVAKLLTSGIDIVVVCDSAGTLEGVITKTDVVKKISICEGTTCMCPISSAMTKNVALCQVSDCLKDVSELMRGRHLKNIPVVDINNRPIGILTAREILRSLLSDVEYDETLLLDYVKGIGYR